MTRSAHEHRAYIADATARDGRRPMVLLGPRRRRHERPWARHEDGHIAIGRSAGREGFARPADVPGAQQRGQAYDELAAAAEAHHSRGRESFRFYCLRLRAQLQRRWRAAGTPRAHIISSLIIDIYQPLSTYFCACHRLFICIPASRFFSPLLAAGRITTIQYTHTYIDAIKSMLIEATSLAMIILRFLLPR